MPQNIQAMKASLAKQEIIVAYLTNLVENSTHFDVSSRGSFRAILAMEKEILIGMQEHIRFAESDV